MSGRPFGHITFDSPADLASAIQSLCAAPWAQGFYAFFFATKTFQKPEFSEVLGGCLGFRNVFMRGCEFAAERDSAEAK